MDYAATTPLDPRVLEAMKPYYTTIYGNASSINLYGLESKNSLENARKIISKFMNSESNQLIFTGSATEANNLILKGHAFKVGKDNTHIAISTIEHDCILNSAKWLESKGFAISYIPVNRMGVINMEKLEEALKKKASLVSVIHANNETGTVQSIKEIGNLCHEYGALFHTDAAQSFGKIPIDVKKMHIDAITINAHKIYGPKGVGALYLRDKNIMEPLLHGGGQEFGLRSSTENVPGIIGFAKAVELRKKEMRSESERLFKLKDQILNETLKIDASYLNGHPIQSLPNIANLRFSYIEGESLLLLLNDEGIAASTGSACSSGSQGPSHVLLSLGLKPEEAHGSLRLSLGKYNTREDVDYLNEVLPKSVEKLREMSPLYLKE